MADDLRTKFERWCFNDTTDSPNFNTERNALGDYAQLETNGAWHAWLYLSRDAVIQPQDVRGIAMLVAEAAWRECTGKGAVSSDVLRNVVNSVIGPEA